MPFREDTMSDSREEMRAARKATRVAHVAGRIERYLLAAAAAFLLFVGLNHVPALAWDGWGYGAVASAMVFATLLIWISEHRRPA